MKRGKFYLIELPIYNIDIAISIGQDYKSFKKSVYSVWNIPESDFPEEDHFAIGVNSAAVTCCRTKGNFFVPYAIKFEGDLSRNPDRHKTIAHEVMHVTTRILHSRGLELCYESEEAYCYLQGHLTNEIYKRLK